MPEGKGKVPAARNSASSPRGGIVRAPRPTRNYTQILDEVLRDQRISFRALGVLVELLSRPDNWQTRAETLAAGRKEGREAVRTALAELRKAGYLVQRKVRENGRIFTVSYVYDTKQDGPADAETEGAGTGDGFSGAGFLDSVLSDARTSDAGSSGPIRTPETNSREELPRSFEVDDVDADPGYRRREASSREHASPIPPQRRDTDRSEERAERQAEDRAAAIPVVVRRFADNGWNDFTDFHAGVLLDHLGKRRKISSYVDYLDALSDDDLDRRFDRAWAAHQASGRKA